MSTSYAFTENQELLDSTVLVEESIVWDQRSSEDQVYSDSSHSVLTTTVDESYVTADEDQNETQYFSILDPSILGDENVSVQNSKIIEGDEATHLGGEELMQDTTHMNGHEVLLYNVPGDGLYGIQVAEDEDGNLQKYQFKIRPNDQGQLEAITESIQVLPMDYEETANTTVQAQDEMETILAEPQQPLTVLVKQEIAQEEIENETGEEQTITKDTEDELRVNEEEQTPYFSNQFSEEIVDSKSGIMEQSYNIIHKQEVFEENSMHSSEQILNEVDQNDQAEELSHHTSEETETMYVNESSNFEVENPTEEETKAGAHYEQVFIQENRIFQSSTDEAEDDICHGEENVFTQEDDNSQDTSQSALSINENESDNEDYEIVEGMHVTGDTDMENDEVSQINEAPESFSYQMMSKCTPWKQNAVKTQQITPVDTRYLKTLVRNVALKETHTGYNNNGNKNVGNYFIVKYPEKENVATIQQTGIKLQNSNPRSILKSSFVQQKTDINLADEERMEKRFAKSKEATQARLLHNYIAKTTILHAPVRQKRLPRKQTIKPVERQDEEIIVQEVVVSSKGFIETSEDGVLKRREPLKPTEFLKVSDSDDDYDPRKGQKRKKHKRKRKSHVEIVISDSENAESDNSVIPIDGSDDSESENKSKDEDSSSKKRGRGRPRKSNADVEIQTNSLKRKRGRPPKTRKSDSETSGKISEDELEQIRKEVESHIKEIKNNAALQEKLKQEETDSIKNEVKCAKCAKTFPSQNSLRTHMQYHNFRESSIRKAKSTKPPKTNQHKCTDCNQTFKNTILLTRHLQDHEKLGCKICKRIFPDVLKLSAHKRIHMKQKMFRSTNNTAVTPKKIKTPIKKYLTCNVCGGTFNSKIKYEMHIKLHKRYTCTTCSAVFFSKLLLDMHLRENCVKIRSPASRRLTFKNKSPHKVRVVNSPKKGSKTLVCDVCKVVFSTHTGLFKHKLSKHGLGSQSNKISGRKKSHIPVCNKLKGVSGNLRSKPLKD